MRKKQEEQLPYEQPKIEIIEFELENSIATNGDFGSGSMCTE